MKHYQKNIAILAKAGFITILALLLASCSGGNGDVGTPPPGSTTPTTITGKVTISSTVSSKPLLLADAMSKAELQQPGNGKPAVNHNTSLLKALSATTLATAADLSGATVELFDADKSEWLDPVASNTSDSNGNYSLNKLINAATNLNTDGSRAYVNGKSVLPGNYTVIASKYDATTGTTLVAVQAIVKKFTGKIIGNDLVAQDSDAVPTVVSMLGLAKNSDGTFGSSTTPVPVNANIQVFFSMAMSRSSIKNGISITASGESTPIAGKWKVSADLTAATFNPDTDMIPDTVYSVVVTGGTLPDAVKNVYDKVLAGNVVGSFKSAARDSTPPTAIRNSPGSFQKYNMPIITPIRIGVDEELDITSLQLTSKPSLGDKPTIKYVGKSTASGDAAYPYIYEVAPSDALKLNATYSIGVSGGLDMVGILMDSLTFSFTTETASAGITGATPDEINKQLAVKIVLGKWISALNARNTALLTSYMTGDFFWLNDNEQGFSRNDLNRDGRLSLNEFTGMLNTWFKDLDRCGSTVTGEVVTNDTTVLNGITLSGATANIAFIITATPTNTSDATCDSGPDSTLYAVMENINQAWMMTSGSESPLKALTPLTPIALLSPLDGFEFSDPTPPADPLTPEFQWKAVDGATTYMVVLIDGNSGQRTGWAALVDGATATAGAPLSAKFIGKVGDYGNMIVLDTSATGASNPLGFDNMIFNLQPGGDYYWAVIGFDTKTMVEFKAFNFDPVTFLIASSESSNFSVAGVLKGLRVEVKGATSGIVYPYSDTIRGYNVGSESSVSITVTAPLTDFQLGIVDVSGYTRNSYSLSFLVVNGVNTASATTNLSNTSNWAKIDVDTSFYSGIDLVESHLISEFGIYTKGGALPKIGIAAPVTGKQCDAISSATLVGPNGWNNYSSADVCTVSVTGKIAAADAAFPIAPTSLSINVRNNDGNGNYSAVLPIAMNATDYTFSDIPVFKGQNWVSISASYRGVSTTSTLSEHQQNGFGIETDAGSAYTPPIAVTVTPVSTDMVTVVSKTSGDIQRSTWDAGSANSVDVTVTMQNHSGMSTCSLSSDPNYSYRGVCSLTARVSTFTVNLYQGWNYIYLSDASDTTTGNYYKAEIYTTGGTVYDSPHLVTSINGVGQTPSTKYTYDAGNTCPAQVTINGRTTNAGPVNLSMGYSSNAGTTVYEVQTYTPLETVPPYTYTFTQNVYVGGINTINIRDGADIWQGVEVTTTCTSAIPVVFGVTSVMAGGSVPPKDLYGTYQTTAGSVTVSGTAKIGRTITAYVKGQYSSTYTIATATANAYTIPVALYTGYNAISLTDGSNWVSLTVNTTAVGEVYRPPISNVTVSTAKLVLGGGASDSNSSWDSSASAVIIRGDAQVEGAGYYYQSYILAGNYYEFTGTFTVPTNGGAFTLLSSSGFTSIPLGYGKNNFTLKDAVGNVYDLTINTSGGIGAPAKIIQISTPLDGDIIATTGSIKVSGTIDSSFVPVAVYADVYDFATLKYTYFSNQAVLPRGTLALTYLDGRFAFAAPVVAGNQTYIYIYADDANKVRQEYGIVVNKPVR